MTDADDQEAVGYGRPPKATRFTPGRSGNPRGRPKGTKNLATDLREELSETIQIREGGKERRVSKQRALVKSLVAAAVKGNIRATTALVSLCARAFGERNDAEDRKATPADDQILEDFIAREVDRRLSSEINSRQHAEESNHETSRK